MPSSPTTDRARRSWRFAWSLAIIAALTVILFLPMVWGGVRLGQDTATQFYPWYWLLGDGLRHGRIPEWNIHEFSGSPMIGDPQSGWGYVIPMIAFTALPLTAAVWVQIYAHLFLANLGMYLLARRIGMSVVAALVAGLCLAGNGVVYGRIPSGPASYQAVTWLPWILFGAELAMSARSWRVRVGGWTLAAFAISQSLAAWIGQLSYYTALLLGAWMLFRMFWGRRVGKPTGAGWLTRALYPVGDLSVPGGWRIHLSWGRMLGFVIHAVMIGLPALALAAMGLLPKLEFNAVSNASGGEYATTGGGAIGGTKSSLLDRFFEPSLYYPIATAIALAITGLILVRNRFGFSFWLTFVVIGAILTVPVETPLHRLFYLIPGFETLHRHYPERVALVLMPCLAAMAGAGVQVLTEPGRLAAPVRRRALAVAAPVVVFVGLWLTGNSIATVVVVCVALTVVVAAVALFGTGRRPVVERLPRPVPLGVCLGVAILLIVLSDAWLMTRNLVPVAPFGGFHQRQLSSYYAPSPAARFLQQRMVTEGPFRYAGYDPSLGVIERGLPTFYRYQFADPLTQDLVVNNRAIMVGLQDIQGYNPIQIQAYVDYVYAMNGVPQEYHNADVFPHGLTSPLLSALNLKYLIVPADIDAYTELVAIARTWTTVYADDTIRILENPNVLPRAWLVSQIQTVPDGQALPMLASGAVDPRQVALVETGAGPPAPDLGISAGNGTGAGTATVLSGDDPDEVQVTVDVPGSRLLVMSDVTYPAWKAEVDGKPADVLTVDHAFRGVVVPQGTHEVRLVYDSPSTRWGLMLTILAIVGLIGLNATAWWLDRPRQAKWRIPPEGVDMVTRGVIR